MLKHLENDIYNFSFTKIPLELAQTSEVIDHLNLISSTATEKRKEEFLAGRWCGLKVIQAIQKGYSGVIEVGEKGQPIWPKGFIGSISHSKDMAFAVASANNILLGADLELIVNLKRVEVIKKMTLTLAEKEMLDSEPQIEKLATLMFSAKESLYKMLYPKCQCYINFHEGIFRSYDFEQGTFQIELLSEKVELQPFNCRYTGQFSETNGHLVTICYQEL